MKPFVSGLCVAGLAAVLVIGVVGSAYAQRDRNRQHDDFPGAASATFPGGMPTSHATAAAQWPMFVFPPPYLARNPHTDWCLAQTPGYNPYDNTFQGYYGERVYCRSPYGG
jgi:hypothetical protein